METLEGKELEAVMRNYVNSQLMVLNKEYEELLPYCGCDACTALRFTPVICGDLDEEKRKCGCVKYGMSKYMIENARKLMEEGKLPKKWWPARHPKAYFTILLCVTVVFVVMFVVTIL